MDAVGAMELSPAQCLIRLRAATWGRVAISMQTIAMVIPLPVLVVDDCVVFATTPGSRFDRAVAGQPISVQVEGHETSLEDPGEMVWSVVVTGVCDRDEPRRPRPGPVGEPVSASGAAALRWNAVRCSMVQGWRAPVPSWGRDDGMSGRG
jgi:hypothetical protein